MDRSNEGSRSPGGPSVATVPTLSEEARAKPAPPPPVRPVPHVSAREAPAGGPAYLLHPEELVEVELHLLHQVKQLQVSALPAARRPRGRQQQQQQRQQRRRERHAPEPAAPRQRGQPGAGSRHRAGLGKVTRHAVQSAEPGDVAGSARGLCEHCPALRSTGSHTRAVRPEARSSGGAGTAEKGRVSRLGRSCLFPARTLTPRPTNSWRASAGR